MYLAFKKYTVVQASANCPLDNVTVFLQIWIYCPGKDTDRQKAIMFSNSTLYNMQDEKRKKNPHSFIPPQ